MKRQLIYTLEITRVDDVKFKILLSSYAKENIPDLLEKNRRSLQLPKVTTEGETVPGAPMKSFRIVDEKLPFNVPEEQYNHMLRSCEINEEPPEPDDVLLTDEDDVESYSIGKWRP